MERVDLAPHLKKKRLVKRLTRLHVKKKKLLPKRLTKQQLRDLAQGSIKRVYTRAKVRTRNRRGDRPIRIK